MSKKNLLALLAIIIIAGIVYYSFVTTPNNNNLDPVLSSNENNSQTEFNPKKCQYLIDGQILSDAEYFGNDVSADFNGDSLVDNASIIVKNSDGTGTFYYLVVALQQQDKSCIGSNAILLGDRIAPQTTGYKDGEIVVNYADRKQDEPMTAQPSMGISRYFKIETNTLIEIEKNKISSMMSEDYHNTDYGFSLSLPPSWENYSIIQSTWSGELLITPNTKYQGPKIIIRNPNWAEARRYQDIPVMIFTPTEWKLIVEENLSVSAAPIGPSKLGENSKYIFALPPRWYGFTDDLEQEQAVEITKTFKAY